MARNLSIFIMEIAVNEYRNVREAIFFVMSCRIQLGCPDISFMRTTIKSGVTSAPFKRSMTDWMKTVKLGSFSLRILDFQIVVAATALRNTVETKNTSRNTSAVISKNKLAIVGNLIITSTSSLKIKHVLRNVLLFVVELISEQNKWCSSDRVGNQKLLFIQFHVL